MEFIDLIQQSNGIKLQLRQMAIRIALRSVSIFMGSMTGMIASVKLTTHSLLPLMKALNPLKSRLRLMGQKSLNSIDYHVKKDSNITNMTMTVLLMLP